MTVAPASPDIAEASVREFRKGHIQDLSLDRDHQAAWLRCASSGGAAVPSP